ncbi:MAG: hypothetical protein CM15mP91_0920 [Chloroflexota bacterium]|nr:MAG: hypothetical protein CM15mP91_0920 [Chloroflexota bacterium]
MIPQVDTASEAEEAVKYSRYPPLAKEGIAPWFASYLGLSLDDVFEKIKKKIYSFFKWKV